MALAASSYAGHHQPVVRLNDNALGEASPTLRDFRLDKRRGRVVWTGEGGREFTKYFTPPNLLGLEFTPYSLDSEMHHACDPSPLPPRRLLMGKGLAVGSTRRCCTPTPASSATRRTTVS